MHAHVDEALAAVRRHWRGRANAGLILGTGCGDVAEEIDAEAVIPYRDVPGMPRSTALAHKGQLVCGRLRGVPVMAMQGRCHLYEGYSLEQVTLGVRLMQAAGAERLVLSNAAGGLNPRYATGDVVLVADHVNLMWRVPHSLGKTAETTFPVAEVVRLGDTLVSCDRSLTTSATRLRVPPPLRAARPVYDAEMIDHAAAIARRGNFTAHRGVYVAVCGPNYETRAEYRFLRRLGDVVGMSSVPEALIGAAVGLRVLALSLVTNVARPDAPERVEAEQVVEAARRAEPHLRKIVVGVVSGG